MKYLKTSVVAVLSTIILTACSLPGLGGSSENGISIVSGSTTERHRRVPQPGDPVQRRRHHFACARPTREPSHDRR